MPTTTIHPFTAAQIAAHAHMRQMFHNTLGMSSRSYAAIEAATTAADS